SPTAISPLSLHDALPIFRQARVSDGADPPSLRDEGLVRDEDHGPLLDPVRAPLRARVRPLLPLLLPVLQRTLMVLVVGADAEVRSEEHTSELQSRFDLVC